MRIQLAWTTLRRAGFFWILPMLLTGSLAAQGIAINADGAAADPAAILDVDATALPAGNKMGILLPIMSLPQTRFITASSNPVWGHGSSIIPGSMWIYNDNDVVPGGASSQYGVARDLYWWDEDGTRWLRQQTKVVPVQHYASTATTTASADYNWLPISGLTSIPLVLKAGDRVLLSANGAFRLPAPVSPAISAGYANAGARIVVQSGATTTLVVQTATSLNGEAQTIFSGSCIAWGWIPALCPGLVSGTYQTSLKLKDWNLLGYYDVPTDGTYTFSAQVTRVSGISSVLSGGTSSTYPELRSALNVEVIRP